MLYRICVFFFSVEMIGKRKWPLVRLFLLLTLTLVIVFVFCKYNSDGLRLTNFKTRDRPLNLITQHNVASGRNVTETIDLIIHSSEFLIISNETRTSFLVRLAICSPLTAPLVFIVEGFRSGLGSYINNFLLVAMYALQQGRCSRIIIDRSSWPHAYIVTDLIEQYSMGWVTVVSNLHGIHYPVGHDVTNITQEFSLLMFDGPKRGKRGPGHWIPWMENIPRLLDMSSSFEKKKLVTQTFLTPTLQLRAYVALLMQIILCGNDLHKPCFRLGDTKDNFISVHIRSGDKIGSEMHYIPCEKYVNSAVNLMSQSPSIDAIFVLSDNTTMEDVFELNFLLHTATILPMRKFRVFNMRSLTRAAKFAFDNNAQGRQYFLQQSCMTSEKLDIFLTLAQKSQLNPDGYRGNKHADDRKTLGDIDNRLHAKDLFVYWFLAAQAKHIVCTFSSNVCRLMALLRPQLLSSIISLDDSWTPF